MATPLYCDDCMVYLMMCHLLNQLRTVTGVRVVFIYSITNSNVVSGRIGIRFTYKCAYADCRMACACEAHAVLSHVVFDGLDRSWRLRPFWISLVKLYATQLSDRAWDRRPTEAAISCDLPFAPLRGGLARPRERDRTEIVRSV